MLQYKSLSFYIYYFFISSFALTSDFVTWEKLVANDRPKDKKENRCYFP